MSHMVYELYLNKAFLKKKKKRVRDFLGGPVLKNVPSNVGDTGSVPG